MHWADVEAEKLGEGSLVATGEAPSGSIHLGHIRELLTGEAIARASEGDLILIVDSFDPLRKLYPFLDKSYKDHIGKPLSEVPCPCGKHDDYAEHFMEPFLESLEKLGADLEVVYAHEMYAKGDYEEATRKVIEKKEAIADIIEENTGRQLSDDWFPYNPKCSECEKIGKTTITGFEYPFVLYECDCGNEGKADIRSDDGKLPWRCDWPARWWILGIDCEPFGKDHAASGGSWDTGKEIIKEVFDREPPVPVIYEWIQLKGEGPMSSSSGVSIRTEDMLNMVAPEILRFFIMRSRPNTHIDIEPGLAILDLVDEYDQNEEQYFEGEDDDLKRVYELSQVDKVPDEKPERIPYRHLVNLVQIYDDYEAIWKVAKDTGQITRGSERDFELMKERAERVEYWLENYAPDFVKFSIKESLPDVDLSEEEKQFLESYKDSTEGKDWNPEILHQLVHQNAEKIGLSKGKAFRSFYKILLGKSKGPRLGRFLSQLEREFVKERILEAVKN